MARLAESRVAIFGIGGVGGYVVEALARSGVGALDLVDNDRVSLTNLNRQIIATYKTMGMYKVDAAAARIADINPACKVRAYRTFYLPETAGEFDLSVYDYVVDAIDTVSGKLELIVQAKKAGTRIISSMGAGNKMDPSGFMVADLYETSVCPLAKVMRRECRKRGIESLKVVYSREEPLKPGRTDSQEPDLGSSADQAPEAEKNGGGESSPRRSIPGSMSFVPSAAGLVIAGEIVRELISLR